MIVSGDGDFACLAEYLKKNDKLKKIVTPTAKYSKLLKPYNDWILFWSLIGLVVAMIMYVFSLRRNNLTVVTCLLIIVGLVTVGHTLRLGRNCPTSCGNRTTWRRDQHSRKDQLYDAKNSDSTRAIQDDEVIEAYRRRYNRA